MHILHRVSPLCVCVCVCVSAESLVSSESSKGMRKIISGVKISLEHSIESAAQAELGIAARHPGGHVMQ